jgi:hypothetical protein
MSLDDDLSAARRRARPTLRQPGWWQLMAASPRGHKRRHLLQWAYQLVLAGRQHLDDGARIAWADVICTGVDALTNNTQGVLRGAAVFGQ